MIAAMDTGFPELAAIRLGFGLGPRHAPPADAAALDDSVAAAARIGGDALDEARIGDSLARWQAARKSGDEAAMAPLRADMAALPARDLRRRLARALDDPAGFGERLVQFWADHFTVRAKSLTANLLAAAFVDTAIRPHLTGRFEQMLIAATTHPAMLVYLDQTGSSGPGSSYARRRRGKGAGLNENLAREVMELHSLGVGADYAQADVRELAKLLTGLTWAAGRAERFRPEMAEPGADRVLGRSYGGPGTDGMAEIARALTDLARHPATAAHLSRKLVAHFLTDAPTAPMIEEIAAVWRASGGDLAQVHAALARHGTLAPTFRQKARQPFDFLAAGLRALGISGAALTAMDDQQFRQIAFVPIGRMGQRWGQPLGPDGWPEEAAAWITPQALAARIEWALRIPQRLADPLPDPRGFVATALGGSAGEALQWAVPRAESARDGVALVLASADFNRR